jgi:phage-related protein
VTARSSARISRTSSSHGPSGCRSVGRGVWEVRSTLTQGRIARVLFCEREGKMVLLHAFIKKTQKAPAGDLELAIKRKKEVT